jgi:hypothetical protein
MWLDNEKQPFIAKNQSFPTTSALGEHYGHSLKFFFENFNNFENNVIIVELAKVLWYHGKKNEKMKIFRGLTLGNALRSKGQS